MKVELCFESTVWIVFLVSFNDLNEHFYAWNTLPYETNLFTASSMLCFNAILHIAAYESIKKRILENFTSCILRKFNLFSMKVLNFNDSSEVFERFKIS